jgi:serine/threonine-protein kinase
MIGSERRSLTFALTLAASLASLTSLTPRVAFADDKAAAAEVLFEEAKRLASEGDHARACPKLEESQRLDPGLGTLYRLADCYEHVGRTASAWAAFREVAAAAKNAGQLARADDAKKRADVLETTLARCEIRVAAPDTPGLVVTRGSTEVGRGQWSVLVPVDPGEVTVQASAPGRKTQTLSVRVVAGATTRLDVPALEILPAPVAAAAPTGDRAAASLRTPPLDERSTWGTPHTLALVAAAAGVVGVGVGSAFGLVSLARKGDADAHCDAANTCDAAGLQLRRDAISAGNLSTVGFAVGGVLLAGGAVLWFTAPRASPSRSLRAGVAPHGAGIGVVVEMP